MQVFLTPGHLCIVSEYAQGGDLTHYIARRTIGGRASHSLSEPHARALFQQIMSAVDFCHAKGISNRDLKAENVLLMSADAEAGGSSSSSKQQPIILKLCDFGCALSSLAGQLVVKIVGQHV